MTTCLITDMKRERIHAGPWNRAVSVILLSRFRGMGRLWADGWNWWQCANQNPVESTRTHQIPTKKESPPNAFQGFFYPWKPRFFRNLRSMKHDSSPCLPLPSPPPQKKRWGFWLPYFFGYSGTLFYHPEKQRGVQRVLRASPWWINVCGPTSGSWRRPWRRSEGRIFGRKISESNEQWKQGPRLGCLGWK